MALAIMFAAAGGGAVRADDAAFGEGAKKFVEGMADDAIASLTEPDLGKMERRQRFREMMHQYFAFEVIAKWVLGRYWRRATTAERKEYMELFEELMVRIYADRFEKYSGETLKIARSEVRDGKDALVHSKLLRPDGLKPIDVAWRIRSKGGVYKVVDIMVEGLSMGLAQQKEFASVIRQNGGKVKNLLVEMRKRIDAAT